MANTSLTYRCCYLGMFVQAIVINLAPVLFIPFRESLGLSFEQIGRLVLVNFITQVAFDLICGALVDRFGAKRFVVGAHALVCVGFGLYAYLPTHMANPYHGLLISTFVFSMGGGVLEMLLSPIVNALPSERKAQDMSLLHSFYAWGQMAVIMFTALAIYLLGPRHWPWIVVAWTFFPLLNTVGFALAPVPALVAHEQRQRLRDLARRGDYLVALAVIALAGGTEVCMAQWISAFAEKGLGLSKLVGDLGGLALFAATLGLGRIWFGLMGEKVSIVGYLIAGTWLSVAVYLVAALSPWPYVSLAACALAGLGVSLLWPGILSVSAARFPLAGASMFGMLSACGDLGAAVAPWCTGAVADHSGAVYGLLGMASKLSLEQFGLRSGLLAASLFPLLMLPMLYGLRRTHRS